MAAILKKITAVSLIFALLLSANAPTFAQALNDGRQTSRPASTPAWQYNTADYLTARQDNTRVVLPGVQSYKLREQEAELALKLQLAQQEKAAAALKAINDLKAEYKFKEYDKTAYRAAGQWSSKRRDGSDKNTGFYGEIVLQAGAHRGKVITEASVVLLNKEGKEEEVPLLNPYIKQTDIEVLRYGNINEGMIKSAKAWLTQRSWEKRSVFAGEGEVAPYVNWKYKDLDNVLQRSIIEIQQENNRKAEITAAIKAGKANPYFFGAEYEEWRNIEEDIYKQKSVEERAAALVASNNLLSKTDAVKQIQILDDEYEKNKTRIERDVRGSIRSKINEAQSMEHIKIMLHNKPVYDKINSTSSQALKDYYRRGLILPQLGSDRYNKHLSAEEAVANGLISIEDVTKISSAITDTYIGANVEERFKDYIVNESGHNIRNLSFWTARGERFKYFWTTVQNNSIIGKVSIGIGAGAEGLFTWTSPSKVYRRNYQDNQRFLDYYNLGTAWNFVEEIALTAGTFGSDAGTFKALGLLSGAVLPTLTTSSSTAARVLMPSLQTGMVLGSYEGLNSFGNTLGYKNLGDFDGTDWGRIGYDTGRGITSGAIIGQYGRFIWGGRVVAPKLMPQPFSILTKSKLQHMVLGMSEGAVFSFSGNAYDQANSLWLPAPGEAGYIGGNPTALADMTFGGLVKDMIKFYFAIKLPGTALHSEYKAPKKNNWPAPKQPTLQERAKANLAAKGQSWAEADLKAQRGASMHEIRKISEPAAYDKNSDWLLISRDGKHQVYRPGTNVRNGTLHPILPAQEVLSETASKTLTATVGEGGGGAAALSNSRALPKTTLPVLQPVDVTIQPARTLTFVDKLVNNLSLRAFQAKMLTMALSVPMGTTSAMFAPAFEAAPTAIHASAPASQSVRALPSTAAATTNAPASRYITTADLYTKAPAANNTSTPAPIRINLQPFVAVRSGWDLGGGGADMGDGSYENLAQSLTPYSQHQLALHELGLGQKPQWYEQYAREKKLFASPLEPLFSPIAVAASTDKVFALKFKGENAPQVSKLFKTLEDKFDAMLKKSGGVSSLQTQAFRSELIRKFQIAIDSDKTLPRAVKNELLRNLNIGMAGEGVWGNSDGFDLELVNQSSVIIEAPSSNGSGVYITYNGENLILTNAHVVEGVPFTIKDPQTNIIWEGELVASGGGNVDTKDISIVRVVENAQNEGFFETIKTPVEIETKTPEGRMLSFGYRGGDLRIVDVSPIPGLRTDGGLIPVGAGIRSGMSGGGLLTSGGRLGGLNVGSTNFSKDPLRRYSLNSMIIGADDIRSFLDNTFKTQKPLYLLPRTGAQLGLPVRDLERQYNNLAGKLQYYFLQLAKSVKTEAAFKKQLLEGALKIIAEDEVFNQTEKAAISESVRRGMETDKNTVGDIKGFNEGKLLESLVEIKTYDVNTGQAIGFSGIIIDYGGRTLVLTNAHNLENAGVLNLWTADGLTDLGQGNIRGVGDMGISSKDIAVIAPAEDLFKYGINPMPLGPDNPSGRLLALGCPSGGCRLVELKTLDFLPRFEDAINVTGGLSFGMSGGPVFNEAGEIVGMNVGSIGYTADSPVNISGNIIDVASIKVFLNGVFPVKAGINTKAASQNTGDVLLWGTQSTAGGIKAATDLEFVQSEVWRVSIPGGEQVYLKFMAEDELSNINKLASFKMPAFKNIKVETYKRTPGALNDLPQTLQNKILAHYKNMPKVLEDTPVFTPMVNTSGIGFEEYVMPADAEALLHLRDKVITTAEWAEIETLFKEFNAQGIQHLDIKPNMFIRRNAEGVLEVSLIDFSKNPYTNLNDAQQLAEIEIMLVNNRLKEPAPKVDLAAVPTRSAVETLKNVFTFNKVKASVLNLRADGGEEFFLKFSDAYEFNNYKRLSALALPKYAHIDVVIPQIIANTIEVLPESVRPSLREYAQTTPQVYGKQPVIMEAVDTEGVSYYSFEGAGNENALENHLAGRQITLEAWAEFNSFMDWLAKNGVVHGDLAANMSIRYNPHSGKFTFTMWDFAREYGYRYALQDKTSIARFERNLIKYNLFEPRLVRAVESGPSSFRNVEPVIEEQETVFNPALATVKVKVGNKIGSGALLEDRGLRFVLTSGHVIDGADDILLVNSYGVQAKPLHVSNFKQADGTDAALLLLNKYNFAGIKPFRLARFNPKAGGYYVAYGYPEGDFNKSTVEMLDVAGPLYRTTLEGIDKGSSGGPLTPHRQNRDIVGIAQKLIAPHHLEAGFVKRDDLRRILNRTVKDFIADADLRAMASETSPYFSRLAERFALKPHPSNRFISYGDVYLSEEELRAYGMGHWGLPGIDLAATIKTPADNAADIVRNAKSVEHVTEGVWRVYSDKGLELYLKFTNEDEIENLKDLNNFKMPQFNSIEVSIYKLAEASYKDLPARLRQKIEAHYAQDPGYTSQPSVFTYPEDTEGLGYREYTSTNSNGGPFYELGAPITQGEWDEVFKLFVSFKEQGLFHGDLRKNLFIKRNNSNGKLAVTLIDFENRIPSLNAMRATESDFSAIMRIGAKLTENGFKESAYTAEHTKVLEGAEVNNFSTDEDTPKKPDPKDIKNALRVPFIPAKINFNTDILFGDAYSRYIKGVGSSVIEVRNKVTGRQGTGFFAMSGSDKILLTAGHITENKQIDNKILPGAVESVSVRPAYSNAWFNASVATHSYNPDISFLEIKDDNFWHLMGNPLTLADAYPAIGSTISSFGFPWGGAFEERQGDILEIGIRNGYQIIKATEHTAYGSSGGPILFNEMVIGICNAGVCREDIMFGINPVGDTFSIHLGWNEIKKQLDMLHLSRVGGAGSVLNPRGYALRGSYPINLSSGTLQKNDDLFFNQAFTAGTKRMGISLFKLFGYSTRAAAQKMYALGAKPAGPVGYPKHTGEALLIDNLNYYTLPNSPVNVPQYPFAAGGPYAFRGMVLRGEGIDNIRQNGLLLKDVGIDNNNFLLSSGMLNLGALAYMSRNTTASEIKFNCLTRTPSNAQGYATIHAQNGDAIPTIVRVKGITDHEDAIRGITLARDIMPSEISGIDIMLNINGVYRWGSYDVENGQAVFRPYVSDNEGNANNFALPAQEEANTSDFKPQASIVSNYRPQTYHKKSSPFVIGEKGKRFGVGTLKLFGYSTREAAQKMYALGASPKADIGYPAFTGDEIVVDDFSRFALPSFEQDALPEYPFKANNFYIYRGLALAPDNIDNIRKNGLRLEDVGPNSGDFMVKLASIYEDATMANAIKNDVYLKYSRAISVSKYPDVANHYSVRRLREAKPIPTIIVLKGVHPHEKGFARSFVNTDIPASAISKIDVMLNVDGKAQWGQLNYINGQNIFRPYRAGAFASVSAKKQEAVNFTPSLEKAYSQIGNIVKYEPVNKYLLLKYLSIKALPVAKRHVWRLTNDTGESFYLKFTDNAEPENLAKLANLKIPQYSYIDLKVQELLLHTREVEDLAFLPATAIEAAKNYLAENVYDESRGVYRNNIIITKAIDTKGVSYPETVRYMPPFKRFKLGKPITNLEWSEVEDFYRFLNINGINHGDPKGNMFLKRNAKTGRLGVSVIDFENPSGRAFGMDADLLKMVERNLIKNNLKERPFFQMPKQSSWRNTRVMPGVFEVHATAGKGPAFASTGFYATDGKNNALFTSFHGTSVGNITVRPANSNTFYDAKIAARSANPNEDYAILEVRDAKFWRDMGKPIMLSELLPVEGGTAYAFGFPYGKGIFESRPGLIRGVLNFGYFNYVETSRNTSVGYSGGPLMLNNKIIGMSLSAKDSKDPISRHISSVNLRKFINDISLLRPMPLRNFGFNPKNYELGKPYPVEMSPMSDYRNDVVYPLYIHMQSLQSAEIPAKTQASNAAGLVQ